jgi:hypothetical protein
MGRACSSSAYGERRITYQVLDNMKIIKHSVDSGMCGGIILKYLKGMHTDQF